MNPAAGPVRPSHTRVMGVLNVTPDSFSDGGQWLEPRAAVRHGLDLLNQGAEILDVGGESTRPGATRPVAEEELRRVMPVITELAASGALLSIDTMRAAVAREAVAAGARIVNDVSGGLADPAMLPTVAELGVDYLCQHWRGPSVVMNSLATYTQVVPEVVAELRRRIDACLAAGIEAEHLIIDPGLGFAKRPEHDWALVAHLDALTGLGYRVVIGASRKRFLGALPQARPVEQRDAATAAVSVICAQHGIWAVRTHEVPSQVDAIAVVERLAQEP